MINIFQYRPESTRINPYKKNNINMRIPQPSKLPLNLYQTNTINTSNTSNTTNTINTSNTTNTINTINTTNITDTTNKSIIFLPRCDFINIKSNLNNNSLKTSIKKYNMKYNYQMLNYNIYNNICDNNIRFLPKAISTKIITSTEI